MIIPSIDLMNGRAVQLRQGKDHILTADMDPVELARTFNRYGEIAVIDLDAAMGRGDNIGLIRDICRVADARVGGGIREKTRGQELLRAGARKLIIGTAANEELLRQFPQDRVMVALDHKEGKVVDEAWTRQTGETVLDRATRLAPFCSGFLCTFVEDEGGMGGMNLAQVQELQEKLPRPVTVAGGVAHTQEAIDLCKLGLDVQVGMALYTGKLDPVDVVIGSLDFDKSPLIPTIVQDLSGQVLMLAYSNKESLGRALREGKGIYYSRSRQEIWEKGYTSGNSQILLRSRTDCDRDALLFTVDQNGPTCHTGEHTCFGQRHFGLHTLYEVLKDRKATMPEGSFSAKLFANRNFLLRKIMEEAFEATLATDRRELTWEIADAIFFLSVLAVSEDVSWADIEAELGGRHA
jgi:phosphoribosyl-ATP pyrophosphohydrolase